MIGTTPLNELITANEALNLFTYATLQEMTIAANLYQNYNEAIKPTNETDFDFFRLLSFIYNTGRVQGIREERSKRK